MIGGGEGVASFLHFASYENKPLSGSGCTHSFCLDNICSLWYREMERKTCIVIYHISVPILQIALIVSNEYDLLHISVAIIVELNKIYMVNYLDILCWDNNKRSYSYYIEVSVITSNGYEWLITLDFLVAHDNSLNRYQFDTLSSLELTTSKRLVPCRTSFGGLPTVQTNINIVWFHLHSTLHLWRIMPKYLWYTIHLHLMIEIWRIWYMKIL